MNEEQLGNAIAGYLALYRDQTRDDPDADVGNVLLRAIDQYAGTQTGDETERESISRSLINYLSASIA